VTELIRDYWSQIVIAVGGIVTFVVFKTRQELKQEELEKRMSEFENNGTPFARENVQHLNQQVRYLEVQQQRTDGALDNMVRKVNEMHTSIEIIKNILTRDK
jgi:peptidoglycan hydrolase CwlO-like protein